jgi:hypothetical protein
MPVNIASKNLYEVRYYGTDGLNTAYVWASTVDSALEVFREKATEHECDEIRGIKKEYGNVHGRIG